MDYIVVFDAVENGYHPGVSLFIGLFFVALGAAITFVSRSMRHSLKGSFAVMFFGFAIFWTFGFVAVTWSEYYEFTSSLRENRCDVIEGAVEQFHPMPIGGHDVESFVVSGKHFEYSDWTVTSGFHQSSTYGGPIRGGMHVRIHHIGTNIVRLEIAGEML